MLTNKQWEIFYQLQALQKEGKMDTDEFNELAEKLWESLNKEEPKVDKGKAKLR